MTDTICPYCEQSPCAKVRWYPCECEDPQCTRRVPVRCDARLAAKLRALPEAETRAGELALRVAARAATVAASPNDAETGKEIERLRADLARVTEENARLREAMPSEDEWIDGELALSVYAETTRTSRKPGWEWALRVRSVLARLDAARKGGCVMTRRVDNDRGLGRYGESDVVDSYRQTIRVQDSSACADNGPCVWIFCEDEDGRDFVEHPPAPRGIVVRSPHLTAKQAVEVANRLLEFVELAAPEALEAAVIPGRPDFHETCRNYESALDYGVQETMDIAAENERLRTDLARVTGERDKAEANYRFMVERAADEKLDGYRELGARAAAAENERDAAIAQSLAAQSQAARSVLDATARAEAAEHSDASFRAEVNELLPREFGVTVRGAILALRERAEAAERLNKYLLGETIYTVMQMEAGDVAKEIVGAMMDALHESWDALTEEQVALCRRILPERLPRAVLFMEDMNTRLEREAAETARWKAVAESRPEITAEDSRFLAGWIYNEIAQSDSDDPTPPWLQRVCDALHAMDGAARKDGAR